MVSCGQNCARPCHIPLKKICLKKGDGYVYWYVCIWIYESVICNSNMYVKYLIYIYVYIFILIHISYCRSRSIVFSYTRIYFDQGHDLQQCCTEAIGPHRRVQGFRWISTFSTLVLDRAGEPGSWKFGWSKLMEIDVFFLYILLKCWFFGGWKKGCVLECESY